MRKILALTLVAVLTGFAGTASAQVTDLTVSSNTSAHDAGFVVNQLFVTFDGQLFGNQILTDGLQLGDIWQETVFSNSNTAPSTALAGAFPSVAADTYVQFGSTFNDGAGSITPSFAGAAVDIDATPRSSSFNTQTIDIAYFDEPGGLTPLQQANYFVGQITLKNTANGTLTFLGNAGTANNNQIFNLDIVNGVIVPEPATVALLALGGLMTLARRRRA